MTQTQRRRYLIEALLAERPEYRDAAIPWGQAEQQRLLRSLCNLRPPWQVTDDFLRVQDEYLRQETAQKGITRVSDLTPVQRGTYLWKGDITTLQCDAIVNAANSRLLGCFLACHGCIDNAIHTYAGVQLRLACAERIEKLGGEEPAGHAVLTPAFNLPCNWVLHTVGPIVTGEVTETDRRLLRSCYRSCLHTAEKNGLKSVAFCCISTGEFHFPADQAAQLAVSAVNEYRNETHSEIKVIFNVFKDSDYQLYRTLLVPDK